MRINGFLGTSLLEYPGKITAVVYTSPCNFRCGFCHNPFLIQENNDVLYMGDVMRQIAERKKLIDAVTITGGEPTLQQDLAGFLNEVKGMGLKTKVDTNGYNTEVLSTLIDGGLIDYVAMDIKTSFNKYIEAARVNLDVKKIRQSTELLINSGIRYEFRTTVVPGIVEEKDIEEIGEAIRGAELYALQQFSNSNTFDKRFGKVSPYSPELLNAFAETARRYVTKVEIRNI